MVSASYINRLMEMFPEEFRLIHQAKSGDANAFVELYDAYVERVYRYIYFLAPNNGVAEGLTFQVFLKPGNTLIVTRYLAHLLSSGFVQLRGIK